MQAQIKLASMPHGGGEAALPQPCRIKPPIGRPLRLSVGAADPDPMITSMPLDDSMKEELASDEKRWEDFDVDEEEEEEQ